MAPVDDFGTSPLCTGRFAYSFTNRKRERDDSLKIKDLKYESAVFAEQAGQDRFD